MLRHSTPSPDPTLLGIEAGGTHTVALAVGGGSAAPIRQEFGPANLYLLDDGQLVRRLRTIARAMPRPDAIAIGMSGARTPTDHARVRRAAARAWPGIPCYATSDLETALMAADAAPPARRAPRVASTRATSPAQARASKRDAAQAVARVLVVSGTGSCCFGRSADGTTARLGGWGHIIGDKGSGYDITVRALTAIVRVGDRRGTWPALGQRFLAALLLNDPHDLVTWAQAASKSDIAGLALEVFRAAEAGDEIAAAVLASTVETLATDGVACARLVARAGAPVQFVLAGSVLLKQPAFARRVAASIRAAWPGASVSGLEAEGVWGAVELARRQLALAGTSLPRRAPVSPVAAGAQALASPLSGLLRSPTEQRNPRSMDLDMRPVPDAVALMLEEDKRIPRALLAERDAIARGVSLITRAFARGGRLFYVGAGTSGRLGVLDASECPPTFNTPPDMIQGVIAGGPTALWTAVEGAEDDADAGGRAIASRGVTPRDVVVGIAASGRTPFVWGALAEARRRGAKTILLCFNPHVIVPKGQRPTLVIAPDVGPEILTGSTRLKAGTATKLVLNVFTTLSMVRMGKVRSNLMIDVRATNTKLRDRAVRIVVALTGADHDAALAALERSRWNIPAACTRLASPR
jgi:N-acetylmuramic acid 6-phosphate etherase